ncbi:MAG TPA: TatD family hydrolase [Acidimicrobiales bacterium]
MSGDVSETIAAWTDSHCHLHDESDTDELLARARQAGVERLILVGTDPSSSARAVELATSVGDGAYATVGLHPHEATLGTAQILELLQSAADSGSIGASGAVVGVGECGLDYYYEHSPRATQREVFTEQIALAKQFGLALVIHTRDAWDDTFEVLRSEGAPDRTVIHCFSGGVEEASACLDLGCYISVSGIVTFKNAGALRDAARFVPDDRILVETDAPYLAPVPHRGQRNEPAWVAVVGEAVAAVRGTPIATFAALTRENTARVFQIPS